MKTIILDDEQPARNLLNALLKKYCPYVEVIGEADNIEEGLTLIQSQELELLFLDISFQDCTGFDLLDQISLPNFKVVFTTAHDDFAIKAFQYNAFDYLLKPISPRDLQRIMQKISLQTVSDYPSLPQKGFQDQLTSSLQRIAIPSLEGVLFLDLVEIIRLESEGKYTTFFYGQNQKAVVSKNLGHYANLLPLDQFHRVDQSHIVNLQFVRKYLHEDGGYVLLKNGDKIKVARRRKEALLDQLSSLPL